MASAFMRAQDSTIHTFTAQQAAEYAMKNNVQVKNALLDIQLQEQTNRDLTSAAYPQLNANGSFTYNAKIPVSLVPGDFFWSARYIHSSKIWCKVQCVGRPYA
jgi:hypothetical protein